METRSDGDPRVLFAMNIILSAVFGTGIIWGLSFIEIATFSHPEGTVWYCAWTPTQSICLIK
jgi:hypothetical protein